jgi:hypothetical protein
MYIFRYDIRPKKRLSLFPYRKKILEAFVKGLGRFNGDYVLCKEKGKNILLMDAISLVIQPRSEGCKAQDETKILLENLGWKKKEK